MRLQLGKPNPYLLVKVFQEELKKAKNDELAASCGNPNIRNNRSFKVNLNEQRKKLMQSLHEKEIDLPKYMKSMGALSLKHDKRIKLTEPVHKPTTNNYTESSTSMPEISINNYTENTESTTSVPDISVNESEMLPLKGDNLRNAREANDNTLAFTKPTKSKTTTKISVPKNFPKNATVSQGFIYARRRLNLIEFIPSPSQPKTKGKDVLFIIIIYNYNYKYNYYIINIY